jgi:sec-independent protein translocase protein TatB
MLFILVLALLVFGPKRLPEIGRTLGKGMAEFRKASTELKRTINTELALEEEELPSTAAARRFGLPATEQSVQPAPILPQGPPPEAQPRFLDAQPRSLEAQPPSLDAQPRSLTSEAGSSAPEDPVPAAAEPAPAEPGNQPVEPQ